MPLAYPLKRSTRTHIHFDQYHRKSRRLPLVLYATPEEPSFRAFAHLLPATFAQDVVRFLSVFSVNTTTATVQKANTKGNLVMFKVWYCGVHPKPMVESKDEISAHMYGWDYPRTFCYALQLWIKASLPPTQALWNQYQPSHCTSLARLRTPRYLLTLEIGKGRNRTGPLWAKGPNVG